MNTEERGTGDRPHRKEVQAWFRDNNSGKIVSQSSLSESDIRPFAQLNLESF